MKTSTISHIALLLITFLVYSLSSVFSKCASLYTFLSIPYISYFIGVILALATYAILWQKILSIMPLNKAFLCKSTTILMILAISIIVFDEKISINNILGAALIVTGLGILAWKE